MHDRNSFVTLTYDKDPRTLVYRDFQLFMKRLRKELGATRFMMCGEYGGDRGRPHFHAILFGRDFDDRRALPERGSAYPIHHSDTLRDLWTHGFVSVGDFSFESAAYVARYCLKKRTGASADEHYEVVDPLTGEITRLVPEMGHMSRRPGIGDSWIRKFMSDVYPHGLIVVNGREVFPPRFYDRVFESLEPGVMSELKAQRALSSDIWEQTPERRAVRETVARARSNLKKRSL